MENVIKFEHVSFGYDEKPILEDINLEIHKGDYVGIIGQNGAGKSTLLKLMINEIKSVKGKIKIFGTDINAFNSWEEIGYVNQKSNSFSSSFPVTVREVVAMNLVSKIGLFKRIKKKHLEEVDDVLKLVGVYEYKDKLIGSLSGGQQQKVFIARELMKSPKMLFLDEPTVGIDINGQREFYKLLKELNEKLNLTIVIVSHDLFIVKEEVKNLVLIKNHNIKFIQNAKSDISKNMMLDFFSN
ncbi:metal ABC transporter ATP-binding protein [Romboutsia lituseburensis]|uniref:metal ABC transporter ATP-binding protein n=1 Tax=Romboutsia lituseburensis TaxID=1537 RepID=UPI00215AB36D|nr:ABC transporter ATP-binding protein [Romboutsia lituseburensis]MCR8743839.1 ABC transporter ATP-binding protein [Romboutsia lituseburensis]